ncbi:nucleotidyltransferase domain-containing protein [Synechococcus sp. BSF8S]|uniref:nucleotidyltransferase domain-containing protein n=1 Tax=Synechococcales TaxID=1890424 RepID=UPI0016257D6D|nr:nucleotidyltransferase domain-containing protein [Synechococcus sp. BSF8S]MBC1261809.1 nucleotidyltransferase domain-containing protein [Synechococcus sp. BSF8S]MBC1264738.1 nucleotidyltransferase domain-containing protein [Synechococcus sp. BSA11S]
MPVRSLTQSVLRWPDPEQVLAQASRWASELQACRPSLQAVGVFGSYGRGTAGVGSDLDLVLIDATAAGPQNQRLRHWPLDQLPLSCDALVLTPAEFDQLMASGSRMAQELQRDLRWLSLSSDISSDTAPAGTPPLSRAPDTRSGAPG